MDKKHIDPRKARYERLRKRKNNVDLKDYDISREFKENKAFLRNPKKIMNQIQEIGPKETV